MSALNICLSVKCCFIFLLVFISPTANTQFSFKHITSNEGLTGNTVETLLRDSRDYLWIGTNSKGLCRYDGSRIKIYENTDNLPGELSHNSVRYIYEDSKKNLWVGTIDGLNLFDRKLDSFVVFKHNHEDGFSNKTDNYVASILEDTNGNIWAAYYENAGLTKWDYKLNTYVRYRINVPEDNYWTNSLTSIQEDAFGNIWVASLNRGLYKFDPESESFLHYTDSTFKGYYKKKLFIDHKGTIWIGSAGEGLFSFDPSTSKFKCFKEGDGRKGPNSNLVQKIVQLDNNHLLIATDQGGINKYNMATNLFEYIVHDENNDKGLNSSGVKDLFLDCEGILWVGTSRGGVNVYNPKEASFKLFNRSKIANSLSYNIVGCFYEDSKGMIWIGTDGGGIDVYNPQTQLFKNYKHDPDNPYSLSGDVIRCISEDKDGDIWIGTWEEGLNRFDRKTNRFYRYYSDPKDPSSIADNTIWHLMVDSGNRIWLTPFGRGIELFDKEKGVVQRYRSIKNDANSLNNNLVWLIYEDHDKNIWAATNSGLSYLDPKTNKFTRYGGFPGISVWALCRDKEGKIWAGGDNTGLYLFDQDSSKVVSYSKKDGLPDNTIHAIVEDGAGNIWLTTNKGISYFDTEKKKFKNYSKSNGLQGNIFFEQSFLKTRNGNIYFGGYSGFNVFHPDSIVVNDYVPKVYITDFKIFNKSVLPSVQGSPLKQHISETEEIELSWRENIFSFEFIAINYTNSEENKYAYKLEGLETEWNYIEDDRQYVSYTNLDQGKYIFRVKASNNDGLWNEEGASIGLTIHPPWWKTLLFRIIMVLSVLFLMLAFIKFRTYQLRNQKKLLTKMVSERTSQLVEANTILEEKKEEISMQNEELQQQKESLQEINRTLEEQSEEIETQNNELNQHRNYLEQLVEERTVDLQIAMKKVEESDRLKSAFLSNMSHEIRTPMNAIIGFSSVLNEPDLSADEKEEYIDHIKKSSDDLLVMINDILEMSKIQANQLIVKNKLVNIVDLMKDLLATFQLQAKPKGIWLDLDVAFFGDSLKCSTDPIRFKQVLSNLIGNAIKFTENGSVRFGINDLDNDNIVFYVKDTGIGIKKEIGDSVFERFMKVDSTDNQLFGGVGLGLSICRDILNAMGGKIWYDSIYSQGTTFYFTIPNSNYIDVKKNGKRKMEFVNFPDLSDKKILIVEDDMANYKVLELYLKRTRANLTWAKNGLEALDFIKEGIIYDLILMDLKMPEKNGFESAEIIKKWLPDQLIVAQTAFANLEGKTDVMRNLFDDYIEKPIKKEKLIHILNKVL